MSRTKRVETFLCAITAFMMLTSLSGMAGEAVKGGPIRVTVRHAFERTAFERMEQGQSLIVTVNNSTGRTLQNGWLDVKTGLAHTRIDIGDLGDGFQDVPVPLECSGKAGAYTFVATAQAESATGAVTGSCSFAWNLCNRIPARMPVVMWGGATFEQMAQCGFTHSLVWMDHLDMRALKDGQPIDFDQRFTETRTKLNETLVKGYRALGKMSPGGYLMSQATYAKYREQFASLGSDGTPLSAVDFSLARVQQFGFDAGRSIFNNVGMFPAVDLVLTDSEFRDHTPISYRPEARAAFRKHAGYDIPKGIEDNQRGLSYTKITDFPHDRVVADDDPMLTFYRWFWGGGDGGPEMISCERDGVKGDRTNLRGYWDPAVRCPSKWGSGGRSDLIGHWTYAYPDPLVMGLATDELFAMAKGGPSYQQVTKMTQVICYRSATTGPLPKDKSTWTEWEKRLPKAKFITIPPDMLEIVFWQKIARPVRAIMYHGAGSLWPSEPGGYDYTHPGAAPRLAKLTKSVIQPFGPMLLEVPEHPAQVAMLESFTSQIFYGGTTYGTMQGAVGWMHGILCRAHLQPEIVYDETILRNGLDAFKVLVTPYCGVLCEGVVRAIQAWQDKGGILVADEDLCPRLMPDILIERCLSGDKSGLIKKAQRLREELAATYTPYGDAETSEAVLRFRRFGSTDYLFAFNDHRTFGNYVGQHGRVMEQGLPLEATLTVRRPAGVIYDLLAGKAVATREVGGTLQFAADFGPGEGRLYMITERPIAALSITGQKQTQRARSITFTITVTDTSGAALDAVVPLRIDIQDAQGQPSEFSGFHAAKAGQLALTLDLAPNDAVGQWHLRVQELASGKSSSAAILITE